MSFMFYVCSFLFPGFSFISWTWWIIIVYHFGKHGGRR